jgi:hypothetical protein
MESDRISTFYTRKMGIAAKLGVREKVHLLYDDRPNECVSLQVPNADVSVLTACI